MGYFEGKSALVTGGASGIGRALGELLAKKGAAVIVADRNAAGADAVAEGIRRAGGQAESAALDVTDAAAYAALVDDVVARYGRLDHLYNNAGIAVIGEARHFSLDDWNKVLDIDLKGVVHGVHAAYPHMIRQGSGHILNTASLAGLIPAPGLVAYAAAKHGVVGLSVSLRAEAAQYGVKVSALCPGFINTAIFTDSKYIGMAESNARRAKTVAATPESCAKAALKGMERNAAVIPVTGHAKAMWLLERYLPDAMHFVARLAVKGYEGDEAGARDRT